MLGQDKKLNLLIAIHCHQPVSNFPGVFQDAYEKAYEPFLDVFESFNNIKMSLHYSGSLLDWLIDKHPAFIDRIKTLVKQNRIEIIGGGYYEPILTIIPYRDALGQIEMFRKRINNVFECDFKGVWLTERVWEPRLPYLLNEAGVKYTIVDDQHFKISGFDPEKLNGYYICEDQSRPVFVFPGSEKLRYSMPFKLPEDTIYYLKNRLNQESGDLTLVFADDGEKFGLWPGTNKWVYREKWLEHFFTALEANRDWINTITFQEAIDTIKPTQRAYLQCASYREMQEWSNGYFKNFFVKYPEANNLQKKMFFISDRLNELKDKFDLKTLQLIKKYLYMGQFNDAYWHGIFGGLYLNHLRGGAYEYLINAENLLDKVTKENDAIIKCDFDKDGKDELIFSNRIMRLYFRPQEGATISEWDDRSKSYNLTNTISRRYEHYHEQLKEKMRYTSMQDSTPKTIHEQRPIRDSDLEQILFYDKYTRYSLRNYLLEPGTKINDFYECIFKEIGQISNGAYEFVDKSEHKKFMLEFSRKEVINLCAFKITKSINVADNSISIDFSLENFGQNELKFIFGTEFNFSLYDSQFSTIMSEENQVESFKVNDLWKDVKLEFLLQPQANVWHFPVETISDSELGIEKSYQDLCIFFNWPVSLKQNSNQKFKLNIKLL